MLLCYLPLWQGLATFDGLRAESQKILLSPYFVLSLALGLSTPTIQALGLLGTAAALIAGGWMRWRGLPLEVALIATLVLQALVGRTLTGRGRASVLSTRRIRPAQGVRNPGPMTHGDQRTARPCSFSRATSVS